MLFHGLCDVTPQPLASLMHDQFSISDWIFELSAKQIDSHGLPLHFDRHALCEDGLLVYLKALNDPHLIEDPR